MKKNIRQIVFPSRGRVELRESEVDLGPLAPDEVAGPSVASMISPGTEVQGCLLGEQFPFHGGYACVIRVERVGEAVTRAKVGDLAFCMATHRSYHKLQEKNLVVLPATLDPRAACCARFMGIAMSTLTTTVARPPANVLVTGLGLVGNVASRVFDSCGYAVTAVDPLAARRAQLAGSSRCAVAAQTPDTQEMDLAIDCSGHEQAVMDASRTLRKGGELVLIGVPWKRRADLQAFDLLHAVFHRYIHLRSGWEWEVPWHRRDFDRASLWSNLAGAVRWLDQGRLSVEGLYDVRSPQACQQAYDRLMAPAEGPLTTVFDWTR